MTCSGGRTSEAVHHLLSALGPGRAGRSPLRPPGGCRRRHRRPGARDGTPATAPVRDLGPRQPARLFGGGRRRAAEHRPALGCVAAAPSRATARREDPLQGPRADREEPGPAHAHQGRRHPRRPAHPRGAVGGPDHAQRQSAAADPGRRRSRPRWGANSAPAAVGRRSSTRPTIASAMRSNVESTASSVTGPWPRGTTSLPSATRRPCWSQSSTSGCDQHFPERP